MVERGKKEVTGTGNWVVGERLKDLLIMLQSILLKVILTASNY